MAMRYPCLSKKEDLILIPPCNSYWDDKPPLSKHGTEFDPHNPPESREKPDPRPKLQCLSNPCFACRPEPLRKKPMVANLKLKQLADCYASRVPETCHNRRKIFYDRWQTYLDRLPRWPNYDYTVYTCNDYVDLGVNKDFLKYDHHLPLKRGPRMEALRNFLMRRNLALAKQEFYEPNFPDITLYKVYQPPTMIDAVGEAIGKQQSLYHEDAITRWRELRTGRPEYNNFVQGSTPSNTFGIPFRKDASFTNPINTFTAFSKGNDPPFKEYREVKKAM